MIGIPPFDFGSPGCFPECPGAGRRDNAIVACVQHQHLSAAERRRIGQGVDGSQPSRDLLRVDFATGPILPDFLGLCRLPNDLFEVTTGQNQASFLKSGFGRRRQRRNDSPQADAADSQLLVVDLLACCQPGGGSAGYPEQPVACPASSAPDRVRSSAHQNPPVVAGRSTAS